MGHGKETPRQQMIGMMYLFLTAMLAINVSKSVLNAFTLVENSLQETTANFAEKNETTYTQFNNAFQENKEKVREWKLKADSVKMRSDSIFSKIQHYKEMIVRRVEGEDYDMDHIQAKDNSDMAATVMMVEKGGERGEDLRQSLADYRKFLLSLVDTTEKSLRNSVKTNLDTSDPKPGTGGREGENITWLNQHFMNLPVVAVTTLMSKMQSDVRNAEGDVVNYLFRQIEAGSFKFNKLEPIVNAESDYVMKGNQYKANIFIAASDTTRSPMITVGGNSVKIEGGKGKFTAQANSVGTKQQSGVIRYKGPEGDTLKYPFEFEYRVGQPSLTVSPTKMNVLYIGVENPIDISVSGVPANRVNTNISSGDLVQRGNSYVATVYEENPVYVSASVTQDDGSTRNMGRKKFRVKRVPDPIPKLGGTYGQGEAIRKSEIVQAGQIEAVLEEFDFDMNFEIVSFSISTTIEGYNQEASADGPEFSVDQRELIKRVQRGKVYFENIKAKPEAEGTEIRELPTMYFTVQ